MWGSERKGGIAALRIVLWLGLLLVVLANVQAERLPIKTYTTVDGLGSDYILDITRDSRGFLWFSTRDGLSRFDGYRFITYGTEHGLPDPTVNDFLQTRHGVYWVATNGGGVCRFNPDLIENQKTKGKEQKAKIRDPRSAIRHLFTVYPVGDEPRTNRVNHLYEDRAGRLWAGADGGLFCLEGTNGQQQFRRIEMGVPSHPDRLVGVRALVEDREGGLWIGTSWGLVRRWPDGRTIHQAIQPSPSGDPVNALLQDREGRLWVGHESAGLLVLDPRSISDSGFRNKKPVGELKQSNNLKSKVLAWYTTADGLAHNQVVALLQSSDGRIWIGTRRGLTEFDGHRFRSYTTAHGLSDNLIFRLAEDRDGNLWIGTDTSGAIKLALHGFTTYTEADGIGRGQIHSVFEDRSRIHSIFEDQVGRVFVVSGSWVINRFDGQRFTSIQPELPKDASYGYGSQVGFLDRRGHWWLLTTKGLCRLARVSRFEQMARQRPEAIYTSRDGLSGSYVAHLFEDSRGDLWISAEGGLTRWDRATGAFHRYSEADGLPPSNPPVAFSEDRSSTVWIGFNYGGLARYRQGRFTLFTGADGVPSGSIRALYLDHAGRLWVGSNQSGLSRIDDPTADRPPFVAYTTAHGLASNNVRCITEDRWGRIYIGTVRGVDRLDPATGRIKHYTTDDGLASGFVTVAFRDRSGTLWFGTGKGLSRIIPEPDQPPSPPPIWISGLRIAGQTYPGPSWAKSKCRAWNWDRTRITFKLTSSV